MSEDINVNAFSEALNDKMDRDFKNCEYIPVNKAGDTMSGNLTVSKGSPQVICKNTSLDCYSVTAPSSNIESSFRFFDKNGNISGQLTSTHVNNNDFRVQILARRYINDTRYDNIFWLSVDSSGKKKFSHPQIITDYVNGTSGYRIWSNGYCEQWGFTDAMEDYATATITFVKTFANTNYIIQGNTIWQGTNDDATWMQAWKIQQNSLKTTGFSFYNRSSTKKVFRWKVCGYLAEGQY